eukprot:g43382.t1
MCSIQSGITQSRSQITSRKARGRQELLSWFFQTPASRRRLTRNSSSDSIIKQFLDRREIHSRCAGAPDRQPDSPATLVSSSCAPLLS